MTATLPTLQIQQESLSASRLEAEGYKAKIGPLDYEDRLNSNLDIYDATSDAPGRHARPYAKQDRTGRHQGGS